MTATLRRVFVVCFLRLVAFATATTTTTITTTTTVADTTRSPYDLVIPNVTLTKLAFGSCHKQRQTHQEEEEEASSSATVVWQRIQQQEAQVWLWLGDAVYPPQRSVAPVAVLQELYRRLRYDNAAYAALVESTVPYVFGTWDDHDYGGNDMGNKMPDKLARRNAFWDFLGYNNNTQQGGGSSSNTTDRLGVYHAVTMGEPPHQVKILLLDTRTFRDDHYGIPSMATWFPLGAGVACATRWLVAGLLGTTQYCRGKDSKNHATTMLGDEQWQWLQEELASSTAAVHIIASSVQVLSTNPVMEGWCHFPSERTRLLRLLRDVPGTILLSGDVHYAEILDASADAVATEVTSSGLTHVCTKHIYGPLCRPLLKLFSAHRSNPHGGFYIGRNFGSLVIDWQGKSVQVNVHDAVSGKSVLSTGPLTIVGQTPSPTSDEDLEQIATCMDGHLIPVAAAVVAGAFLLFLLWRRK